MQQVFRSTSHFALASVAAAAVGVYFLTPLLGRRLAATVDPVPDYHQLHHGTHSALTPDVPTVILVPVACRQSRPQDRDEA